MNQSKGFTLIEILVVIVIIGIIISVALLAFGDFGASRRILFSADQLANSLRLAQQQSILETSTLGVAINNNRYQILQLQNSSQWRPVSNRGIFKMHYFPENTQITLKINTQYPAGYPAIIINASGDMTPFTLTFGTAKEPNIASVTGTQDGDVTLSKNNNK